MSALVLSPTVDRITDFERKVFLEYASWFVYWHFLARVYALGLIFFSIKNRSQYQHELAEEFSDFKVAAEQHRQLSELGIHFQKDLSDDRVIWVQSFLKFFTLIEGTVSPTERFSRYSCRPIMSRLKNGFQEYEMSGKNQNFALLLSIF